MSDVLKPIKFFIRTFGCQMNESDSEHIAGILTAAGAEKVETPQGSDLIIVNTCAVREKSEEKLYSYLGRIAALKKKKNVRIGVVGCVAQIQGSELLGKRYGADFILGPDNYYKLPQILRENFSEKFIATEWTSDWQETPDGLILRDNSTSAYVPIMEGCSNFCAYCIVPFTRGREKYRPLSLILAEVENLAKKGFREVQLLGQNVNTYRDPEKEAGFPRLLREIGQIQGIEWIRFITSHPKNFSREIALAMKETDNVCRQLHLPAQSGSTSVLKRMRRGYTKEEYLEKISFLRQLMPEISLSTDIIVGFPGETEKKFEETLDLLRQIRFTSIFSFRYSPRPMTRAAELEDNVPFEEKRRRLTEVQNLQKQIQLEKHEELVGRTQKVLCIGRSKKEASVFAGRNEGFEVVNFKSDRDVTGHFVQVLITGFGPYSLRGELTNSR